MALKQKIAGAVAVAASVAVMGGTAWAQSSSPASGSQGSGQSQGSTATGGQHDREHETSSRASSSDTEKFFKKAAIGNLAEIELARLGVEKAENPQVKQFAQEMVDAHQKALDELKQVASGVDLPSTLDEKHQKKQDKLAKLSGAEFDREFMEAMVDAHKSIETLLADNIEGRPVPGGAMAPGTGGSTPAGTSGTTGSGGSSAGSGGTTSGSSAGSGSGGTSSGAGQGAAGTSGTAGGMTPGAAAAAPKLSGAALQWASQALQEVRSHLEQAKQLEDQVKK